jgi:hypothetical protein
MPLSRRSLSPSLSSSLSPIHRPTSGPLITTIVNTMRPPDEDGAIQSSASRSVRPALGTPPERGSSSAQRSRPCSPGLTVVAMSPLSKLALLLAPVEALLAPPDRASELARQGEDGAIDRSET